MTLHKSSKIAMVALCVSLLPVSAGVYAKDSIVIAQSKPAKTNPVKKVSPTVTQKKQEKVQLIILANQSANKDDFNDALKKVEGTVIDTTSDGKNTFYLVEVDKSTYESSCKKLTEDKSIKSVELNRSLSKQTPQ